MTPESAAFLDKAREFLVKAKDMLSRWPDEAGRASYLAAFHAAQAFIFERTGEVLKPIRACGANSGYWSRTKRVSMSRCEGSLGGRPI